MVTRFILLFLLAVVCFGVECSIHVSINIEDDHIQNIPNTLPISLPILDPIPYSPSTVTQQFDEATVEDEVFMGNTGTKAPMIALSFSSNPSNNFPAIVSVLKAFPSQYVTFLTTSSVINQAVLVKECIKSGYEFGIESWNKPFSSFNDEQFKSNISQAITQLQSITGKKTKIVYALQGSTTRIVARQLGLSNIMSRKISESEFKQTEKLVESFLFGQIITLDETYITEDLLLKMFFLIHKKGIKTVTISTLMEKAEAERIKARPNKPSTKPTPLPQFKPKQDSTKPSTTAPNTFRNPFDYLRDIFSPSRPVAAATEVSESCASHGGRCINISECVPRTQFEVLRNLCAGSRNIICCTNKASRPRSVRPQRPIGSNYRAPAVLNDPDAYIRLSELKDASH